MSDFMMFCKKHNAPSKVVRLSMEFHAYGMVGDYALECCKNDAFKVASEKKGA